MSKLTAISSLIYGSYRFLSVKQTKIAQLHDDDDEKWYQKQVEYWDVRKNFDHDICRNKKHQ